MNPLRIFKKQNKNGRQPDGGGSPRERGKDMDERQRLRDEVRRFEYDLRELAKF